MSVISFQAATVPANDAGDKAPVIFDGFAEGLSALNETIPSRHTMKRTSVGRAYKKIPSYREEFDFYAGAVHYESVGESSIGHVELMKRFAADPEPYAGRVYMGTAGMLNLGYIAATKAAAVIFYDINPLQQVFWSMIIGALADCPTRYEFKKFLNLAPPAVLDLIEEKLGPVHLGLAGASRATHYNPQTLSPYRGDQHLSVHNGDGMWDQDEYYPHLHALAKAGAMGAITLDVLDRKSWAQLATWLTRQEAPAARKVGTIYISNIFVHLSGNTDWTSRRKRSATEQFARSNMSLVTDPHNLSVIDHNACASLKWPSEQPKPQLLGMSDLLRLNINLNLT